MQSLIGLCSTPSAASAAGVRCHVALAWSRVRVTGSGFEVGAGRAMAADSPPNVSPRRHPSLLLRACPCTPSPSSSDCYLAFSLPPSHPLLLPPSRRLSCLFSRPKNPPLVLRVLPLKIYRTCSRAGPQDTAFRNAWNPPLSAADHRPAPGHHHLPVDSFRDRPRLTLYLVLRVRYSPVHIIFLLCVSRIDQSNLRDWLLKEITTI